jgi:TM2 domain-containing membrane protein YozV
MVAPSPPLLRQSFALSSSVGPFATITARDIVSGQGSAGNVLAALGSFFVPGLGQLLQGRLLMAIFQFVLAAVLWFFLLGWAVHLWSVLDAAMWKPKT